jgi:hypothetical protein
LEDENAKEKPRHGDWVLEEKLRHKGPKTKSLWHGIGRETTSRETQNQVIVTWKETRGDYQEQRGGNHQQQQQPEDDSVLWEIRQDIELAQEFGLPESVVREALDLHGPAFVHGKLNDFVRVHRSRGNGVRDPAAYLRAMLEAGP